MRWKLLVARSAVFFSIAVASIGPVYSGQSLQATFRSWVKAHKPFDPDVRLVVEINAVQLGCSLYNDDMVAAHRGAFDAALARLGRDKLWDQMFLYEMTFRGELTIAGHLEQFCRSARDTWGEDDPETWERQSFRPATRSE